jgi:hypothetical protein
VDRDAGEHAAAVADVLIVRVRRLTLAGIDPYDLLRHANRHRLQRQRVDDAEDGGVAADGERDGEHGGGREAGTSRQQAQPEHDILAQIAGKTPHEGISAHGHS